MSERHVFEDARLISVAFGQTIEDDDGFLHPHPEHPDRHSVEVLLKEGDKLPAVGAHDRITVIIEKPEVSDE